MRIPPAPLSLDVATPFKTVGGDPGLDLVNTVDWTARGLENDRLADYERFTRWAEAAGAVPAEVAARLRRVAAERPREAGAALEAARWTRHVLQRLFAALAAGEPAGAALGDFNDLLAESLRRLAVSEAGEGARKRRGRLGWGWSGLGENLESPLWPVVWSAAALLTSEEVRRLRVCAGPDCGWMYVDRSRNHLRRWCEMATCGTRAKSRRRARRRDAGEQPARRSRRAR